MLQQTTVVTVIPYFHRFIQRFPTLASLAQASLAEVMQIWQGLGYYTRARQLLLCAQEVVQNYQGILPSSKELLQKLPGIGPYTAAAIASIAFAEPVLPVDGNIIRVMSRLLSLKDPLPGLKKVVEEKIMEFVPLQAHAGDMAQALMDLGALICKPSSPSCQICPLSKECHGLREGQVAFLPKPAAKKEKQTRHGIVFCLFNAKEELLIEQREPSGLLGGLMFFPTTPWQEKPWTLEEALFYQPFEEKVEWEIDTNPVRHTFTHFHLSLTLLKGFRSLKSSPRSQQKWVKHQLLPNYPFPSIGKKVLAKLSGFFPKAN